ncbi:MAG: universal stress protein [Lysobacterales bacterium]
MPFKNILVALHPDESETTALKRAVAIAGHCGATVHLHMVLWKSNLARDLFHVSEQGKADQEALIEQGKERLKKIKNQLDVTVGQTVVHWGPPLMRRCWTPLKRSFLTLW